MPAVSVKGNTFPRHRPSRYPIRYTLRRDWGTPKSLLLSTCHSRPYPNPSSVWRMAANVRPPSWLSSPGTFSRSRYAGLFAAVSRAISKNSVPLGSANPPRFPAVEKGWQGNPPHSRSKSGMSLGSAFWISSQNHSPSVSNRAS